MSLCLLLPCPDLIEPRAGVGSSSPRLALEPTPALPAMGAPCHPCPYHLVFTSSGNRSVRTEAGTPEIPTYRQPQLHCKPMALDQWYLLLP